MSSHALATRARLALRFAGRAARVARIKREGSRSVARAVRLLADTRRGLEHAPFGLEA